MVLLSAITTMIVELVSFFGILIMFYVAFGSTKFLLSGSDDEGSFATAIFTQFWASIDVGKLPRDDAGNDAASLLVASMGPMFAMFVILILMNVLVTMLMDLYEKQKDAAEAHWCLEQAAMIFAVEREEAERSRIQAEIEARQAQAQAPPASAEEEGGLPSPSKRAPSELWKNAFRKVKHGLSFEPRVHRVNSVHDLAMSLLQNRSDVVDKYVPCEMPLCSRGFSAATLH